MQVNNNRDTGGSGGHIRQAIKRTMEKLKPKGHLSSHSSSGGTRRRHSTMSASELEAQPLRYSDGTDEEIYRVSPGDRLTVISPSPRHRASDAISPPGPIPPRRPRPPRHGHAYSGNLGPEGSPCPNSPEYDPFFTFPPLRAEEANQQSSMQRIDDFDGTKELRETLEMKMRLCQSTNDVGQFLISNYCNRDSVLNGMVTRMTGEEESNVAIATAVLNELGLRPEAPQRPQLVMNHRTPPNARLYAQEDGTRDIAWASSASGSNARTARRQDHEVLPTAMRASQSPVSCQKFLPYRPRNSAGASPSSTSYFTGANLFRVREGTLLAPRPRRVDHTIPQWTNRVVMRIKSDLDMHEANLLRGEMGDICQLADDDIPILQPATIQRIRRGYYDEDLDGVRPKAQKLIETQQGAKGVVGSTEI